MCSGKDISRGDFCRIVGLRQYDREATPLALAAHQMDGTAQQAHKLAGDGKAQARSAISAADGTVCLLESLEDALLLALGNPDPGVAHRKGDLLTRFRLERNF